MNSHTLTFRDNRFEGQPLDEQRHEHAHQTGALRILQSTDLFRGAQEVVIDHAGARYRLKITRQGKLILNK